jgi:hypothetical protein
VRYAIAVAVLLLLPLPVSAQRGRGAGPPGMGQQAQMRQRIALERQIVRRFVEQSGREMGLDAEQRTRLETILREGNDRRRDLAERGVELRRRLMLAIRDPDTPDTTFTNILESIDRLREEENAQWRADQDSIRDMFSPRQRALFTAGWLRLQETIRDVISQRPMGMGRGAAAADTLPRLPLPDRPDDGGVSPDGARSGGASR